MPDLGSRAEGRQWGWGGTLTSAPLTAARNMLCLETDLEEVELRKETERESLMQ